MKKGALSIVSIILISCIFFACNDNRKNLQELIQEERKAIDRFITFNNLVILKDYPKDGVFGDNEYYKTNDGLFFQVVDSGNGKRVKLLDDVSVRFDYFQYIKDVAKGDTSKNYLPFYDPFSFVYGISQTYRPTYSIVCQAWVIPLAFVGEEAVLNLIVPSSIGSYGDNNSISPVFYRNLRYSKFRD